jgi:hypothetical protein
MPGCKGAFTLAPRQFAQTFSRKKPLYINHLHRHDKAMTGTGHCQAPIGVAVEFWGRANAGFAGG